MTRKHPDTNVVYVSRRYYECDDNDGGKGKQRNTFRVGPISWCSGARPWGSGPEGTEEEGPSGGGGGVHELLCKVRHGPSMYRCTLELAAGDGEGALGGRVTLAGSDQGLAAGQYAAFYHQRRRQGSGSDGDGIVVCLGSAVIEGNDKDLGV